jgi:hypothetical protein
LCSLVHSQFWGFSIGLILIWFNVWKDYRTIQVGVHLLDKFMNEMILVHEKTKQEKWSKVIGMCKEVKEKIEKMKEK